jgi:hypothetical protein
MTASEPACTKKRTDLRYLELAIPLLSFGSTLAGILAWQAGYEISFQYFALGCVIGSCLLAYLAWIRPRKDIVALSTPLYAFIFFVVPTDYTSGLVLQLLYAVSLTLLLLRLKYRFGDPHTAVSSGKELAAPLREYAERTSDRVMASTADGHRAAVVISRFAMGEYAGAARAAGEPGDEPPSLSRAFAIVSEHATVLDRGLMRPDPFLDFLPEDTALLAIPPTPGMTREQRFDTALDNALLLLFSAAWHSSPADRPHLLACQEFLGKLLGG